MQLPVRDKQRDLQTCERSQRRVPEEKTRRLDKKMEIKLSGSLTQHIPPPESGGVRASLARDAKAMWELPSSSSMDLNALITHNASLFSGP